MLVNHYFMIFGYQSIKVELIRCTEKPLELIKEACKVYMKKDNINDDICKRLIDMNHTSVFEHVVFTFKISGASRAFLAQITRHRIGSFSSGSQHYQLYTDSDSVMGLEIYQDEDVAIHLCAANALYKRLISEGVPREEARMILPNCMVNDLVWTVNARSLINFLNLRLCSRNVYEMRVVAHQVWFLAMIKFPEIFDFVGPDCLMSKCRQGNMRCKDGFKRDLGAAGEV